MQSGILYMKLRLQPLVTLMTHKLKIYKVNKSRAYSGANKVILIAWSLYVICLMTQHVIN